MPGNVAPPPRTVTRTGTLCHGFLAAAHRGPASTGPKDRQGIDPESRRSLPPSAAGDPSCHWRTSGMAARMAQQQRDARGPREIRPRGADKVRARAQKPAGWPGLDRQARDVAPDPRQKVEGMPGPRDCPAGGARSRRTIRSALHSSAGRGAADLRRTASCDPPSGSGTGQTAARTAGAKDPRAGPSAPRHAIRPAAQGRESVGPPVLSGRQSSIAAARPAGAGAQVLPTRSGRCGPPLRSACRVRVGSVISIGAGVPVPLDPR